MLEKKFYDEKSEMWACGVLFYSLLAGDQRGSFRDHKTLFEIYKDKLTLEGMAGIDIKLSNRIFCKGPRWDKVSDDTKELIVTLLKENGKERYSASEALKLRIFKTKNVDGTLHTPIMDRFKQFKVDLIPRTRF